MRLPMLSGYSTSYKFSLTVATKLVLSPYPSKLNDAQTGLASAKKMAGKLNCVTGVHLQNYGIVTIPEVILQSTFSRTFSSFSKQKRVNTNDHNSATRYFDDKTSGAFYS